MTKVVGMDVSSVRRQLSARMKEDELVRATVLAKVREKEKNRLPKTDLAREIAIVGMSCRFPGTADPEEYFQSLIDARDLFSEVPWHRWAGRRGDQLKLQKMGVLSDVFGFDNELFRIAVREAEAMDPHQRLLLEEVWLAIENAGYISDEFKRRKTGVFVAMYNQDFMHYASLPLWDEMSRTYLATGSAHSLVPNRISYTFDLRGPSEITDTACSSGLVAIHRAAQSIRNGECAQAIVGGVSLILRPERLQMLQNLGLLSSTSCCAPFDANSNGQVPGEGVAVLILKSMEEALHDRDNIHAVLSASGVNHQGRNSLSLTLPSHESQAELINSVYEDYGLSPDRVSYIEAHGSGGTADHIELLAFQKHFEAGTKIGSVKGNTGFLEAAGGFSQVIKTIMALKKGVMPATRHHTSLPQHVGLNPGGLGVLTCNTPLDEMRRGHGTPFVAAVNAYGLGGVNAHLVLKEHRLESRELTGSAVPIFLSAADRADIQSQSAVLLTWLEEHAAIEYVDVAFTLAMGRVVGPCRAAFLVRSRAQLLGKLGAVRDLGEESSYPQNERLPGDNANALRQAFDAWVNGDVKLLEAFLPSGRRVDLPRSTLNRRKFPLPTDAISDPELRHPQSHEASYQPGRVNGKGDDWIRHWIARQCGLDIVAVDADTSLGRYGIDSVAIVSFCGLMSRRLSLSLSPSQITEQATIKEVSNWIRAAYKAAYAVDDSDLENLLVAKLSDNRGAVTDVARITSLQDRDRMFHEQRMSLQSQLHAIKDPELVRVCEKHVDRFEVFADAHGGVWLFLRAGEGNIMGSATIGALLELLKAISQCAKSQFVPALYLSHVGRHFCLGGDRESYMKAVEMKNGELVAAAADQYRSILHTLGSIGCLTVSVAYGSAQGGGFELMMATDLQFVWPGVKLGLPEIHSGLLAGMGGIGYVSEIAGFQQALRLNLGGGLITGEEAAALGLISQVSQNPFLDAQSFVMAIPDHTVALSIRDVVNAKKFELLEKDIEKWVKVVSDGHFLSHGNKIRQDFAVIRQQGI
jgi:3-oxoacyl-(acyl-carrier-protein) synthase/enoyl-CoA hydratase/carnithine racemase/acyl carrier protein